MSESKWAFGCELGLRQETCGLHKPDPESRGVHAGYGGCCSCEHREPANPTTETAERAWWFERNVIGSPVEAVGSPRTGD
ncbi:MAG: hypothetical protein IT330_12370 [Anaerolineae bacterium]|nr:hypothetical protein [Anaerolineae bacterium]